MAILILPSRAYANILEKAVGTRSLKIRRQIEKLRAKKRAKDITRINLVPDDASALTGILYDRLWKEYEDKEILREQLDAYAQMDLGTEPPAIIYSMSEWKAVCETASGLNSNIDLNQFGSWNVYFHVDQVFDYLAPYIEQMIARANGMDVTEIAIDSVEPQENVTRYNHVDECVERFTNGKWVKETLQEFDAANAFGVVEESEDEDADSNQADGNNS